MREFIINDSKRYSPEVTVEFVGGDPRIVFLDEEESELEKVDIAGMMRYEINDLMKKKGFTYDDKIMAKVEIPGNNKTDVKFDN